jgi:ATP/maltotriose-dependent transcriptional regulator MalT
MRAARALASAAVEQLAGDGEAAVRELRHGYEALEQMGERGTRATIAAFLAHALAVQGEYEDAKRFAAIGERTGAPADIVTQAIWRSAHAHALVHEGELEEAERLAREAVELARATDFLDLRASTALDLAAVLRALGRDEASRSLIEEARAAYLRKGNIVAAGRVSQAAPAR